MKAAPPQYRRCGHLRRRGELPGPCIDCAQLEAQLALERAWEALAKLEDDIRRREPSR